MAARKPVVLGLSGPQELAAADTLKGSGPAATNATDLMMMSDVLALLAPVNNQTGTAYTLAVTDRNSVVVLTNSAAITVTVPATLAAGFNCTLIQGGAGAITFAAASGATLSNQDSYTKTTGQYGVASLFVIANSGGSAAQAILAGVRG